eukprot:GEMP01036082.1.p1 GENE.GEMP01036082.1~~GEMP01036082.1.p1  ORF type:complete len:320 (+),score=52.83 GEMP01036082.1:95-1054(+)
MSKLSDRYEILDLIGAGVYGTVSKAVEKATNELVALKRFHFTEEEFDAFGIPSPLVRELSSLRELRDHGHPNIVTLKEVFCERHKQRTTIYAAFEFVQTDLRKFLLDSMEEGKGGLPSDTVLKCTAQLLQGLDFMHRLGFMHRDLKPQNLLVSPSPLTLKIADFGLCRKTSVIPLYTQDSVTLWYRAPELLMMAQLYGQPVDLWSAGCIMVEMATGYPLFPGNSAIGTLFLIFQLLGTPSPDMFDDVVAEAPELQPTFPQWRSLNEWPSIHSQFSEELLDAQFDNLVLTLLRYNPTSRTTTEPDFFPYLFDAHAAAKSA